MYLQHSAIVAVIGSHPQRKYAKMRNICEACMSGRHSPTSVRSFVNAHTAFVFVFSVWLCVVLCHKHPTNEVGRCLLILLGSWSSCGKLDQTAYARMHACMYVYASMFEHERVRTLRCATHLPLNAHFTCVYMEQCHNDDGVASADAVPHRTRVISVVQQNPLHATELALIVAYSVGCAGWRALCGRSLTPPHRRPYGHERVHLRKHINWLGLQLRPVGWQ